MLLVLTFELLQSVVTAAESCSGSVSQPGLKRPIWVPTAKGLPFLLGVRIASWSSLVPGTASSLSNAMSLQHNALPHAGSACVLVT